MNSIFSKHTADLENFVQNQSSSGNINYFSFCSTIENVNFDVIIQKIEKLNNPFFFWSQKKQNIAFIGIDWLIRISEDGTERTIKTEKKIQQLSDKFINNWDNFNLDSVPMFLGGLKFSPNENNVLWNDYRDSDWFVPKILFYKKEDRTFLVFNLAKENYKEQFERSLNFVENILLNEDYLESSRFVIKSSYTGSEEERLLWIDKVNAALRKIEEGEFQKIVLSRSVNLSFSENGSITQLLKSLSTNYPRCYVFAFRQNNSTFFGASPERLAKISNGIIEADALAGSIKRGKTPVEDLALENELLTSKKNLNEQKAVVHFIANSFSEFATDIEYNPNPIIRKLPNIQHLWTPIKAKLSKNRSVFAVLKSIHPTPAICGVPWSNALISIRAMEQHARGLYAGIIGWFNFNNEGEFAVSIRSALLKKNELYAFAGCGIVDGSDPIAEYEEINLKLKPILNLFEHEEIHQS
ncbi:MAG: isochorismate synthase [Melioribacteraceae bacterium]|nr:isochorismate synthase [Melioribacteraceae bacterium]